MPYTDHGGPQTLKRHVRRRWSTLKERWRWQFGEQKCESNKATPWSEYFTTWNNRSAEETCHNRSGWSNLRTIFAPYHQSSLSLWSSVPTKNTVKPKFFQPNETCTQDYFMLQRTSYSSRPDFPMSWPLMKFYKRRYFCSVITLVTLVTKNWPWMKLKILILYITSQ